MNLTTYPAPYQSAFREACFVLGGLSAASGLDIRIYAQGNSRLMGVKRIYATDEAAVNAAPYVRRLLSPEPLCGRGAGMAAAEGRAVDCSITADGLVSDAVYLTSGTDDAPTVTVLSASPETVKIRPGEKDEVAVITGGTMATPMITFMHDGEEYTDYSLMGISGSGMLAFVVDADDAARRFSGLTGADASEMTGFTVWLRIQVRSSEVYISRSYEMDRDSHGGRRLAWINRYGAVDYYTFPYVSGGKTTGSRERIYTPAGYRTVATIAATSETLLSEASSPETVEWLSEIFSSPAVWKITGKWFERVEVADGGAEYSSGRPGTVSVTIAPAKKTVSRKS